MIVLREPADRTRLQNAIEEFCLALRAEKVVPAFFVGVNLVSGQFEVSALSETFIVPFASMEQKMAEYWVAQAAAAINTAHALAGETGLQN